MPFLHLKKILLQILLLLIISVSTFGQTSNKMKSGKLIHDSIYVKSIKQYILFVDSLSNPDFATKFTKKQAGRTIRTLVAEGTIEQKKPKRKGGFSKSTIADYELDSVYRINLNDNLQKYLVQQYYYKANKLVAAKIELQDWAVDKLVIFSSTEYFENDKLYLKETPIDKLKSKDRWRVTFDFRSHGNNYLSTFFEERNEKKELFKRLKIEQRN